MIIGVAAQIKRTADVDTRASKEGGEVVELLAKG